MKQKHTALITIISLLTLLALVLAGLLSQPRYRDIFFKFFPILVVAPNPTRRLSPPAYVAPVRNLTPDEQQVLNVPLHNASTIEKQAHAQEVVKLVKTASVLDITGCKPTPLVYPLNLKGSFKIKNGDAIPHTIRYLSAQITVPAHGTTTAQTSQLFKTTGDYGYGCDNPFAKMGVFMVR